MTTEDSPDPHAHPFRSPEPDADSLAPPQPVDPEPADATSTRRRFAPGARVAAPVVAALLVGAGAAFAVDHHSTTPTAAAGAVASGPDANGPGAGGPAGFGGVSGEQHIQGTVTAKTDSTVTIKASGGTTATYTVNSTSEIVRNGTAASLSDLTVGDPVFAHVYPSSSSSGQLLVERLFAGSSATDGGGPGGPGGPGLGSPPADGGTTSTTPATHI